MVTPLSLAQNEFFITSTMKDKDILTALFHDYRRFIDTAPSYLLPEGDVEFHLTSRTVFSLGIDLILEAYLTQIPFLNSVLIEQIVTSTHEAISNGLLWGNLELDSTTFREKMMNGDDLIVKKLEDPSFAQRPLGIGLQVSPSKVLSYIVSPHLGLEEDMFPDSPQNPFRGVSIIKTLADEIDILENGQILQLTYFNK